MSMGQRVFGKTLFEFLLSKTMYRQFVAGENLPAIQDTIKTLHQCGIGTMLCIPNEEDLSSDYNNLSSRSVVQTCVMIMMITIVMIIIILILNLFVVHAGRRCLIETQRLFLIALEKQVYATQSKSNPVIRHFGYAIPFITSNF